MDKKREMSNAPVYYVFAQVRFTPIKVMKKYIDDIQEAIRLENFPLFMSRSSMQLKLEQTAPNLPPEPILEDVQQWHMVNASKTSGYILSNDSISFHTTDYKDHESFISNMIKGLSIVLDIAEPALILRVGLRYLDAVQPQHNETVEDYLCEGLSGANLELNLVQSINEQVYKTPIGNEKLFEGYLVTRIHKMYGQLGFPPDITPIGINLNDKFKNTEESWHAIIDTDHYIENNHNLYVVNEISTQEIEDYLFALHKTIRYSFDHTVSEYALKSWE